MNKFHNYYYYILALIKYNFKCNRCGITFKKYFKKSKILLDLHHKDKNSKNNKISNLEILCHSCHSKITNTNRKMPENIKKKIGKKVKRWLERMGHPMSGKHHTKKSKKLMRKSRLNYLKNKKE